MKIHRNVKIYNIKQGKQITMHDIKDYQASKEPGKYDP